MWGLPDNNTDGAEGTIPYISGFWFFGEEEWSGGCGVYSFEECIVFVQF